MAAGGSFTTLSASVSLLLPSAGLATSAPGQLYRAGNQIRYRDSTNIERTILNNADNLSNLSNNATARNNLGAASVPVQWTAGAWVCPIIGAVGAGGAITASVIYLAPFICPRSITFSELGARITTPVGGSNFQLAIYGSDSSGLPTGTPIASTASLSGAVATAISGSATGDLISGPRFWMACNQDSSSLIYQVNATSSLYQTFTVGATTLAIATSGTSTASFWRQIASTYGTWPDLTGATTTETGGAQRSALIFLRVGALL